MERAVGSTFKVDNIELIVKEVKEDFCFDKHGGKCYFHEKCLKTLQYPKVAGDCIRIFRKDGKSVIFIKK